jgi:hypothetical protein
MPPICFLSVTIVPLCTNYFNTILKIEKEKDKQIRSSFNSI